MGEAPVVAETMDLDTVTVLRGEVVGNLGCTLMREAGAVGDGQYGGGGTACGTGKRVVINSAQQNTKQADMHAGSVGLTGRLQ